MNPLRQRAVNVALYDNGRLVEISTVGDSRRVRAARERIAERNGVAVSAVQVTPVEEG